MSAEAEIWTFPTNPDEFDSDERISFSKLDNKYIAVQDDGAEFEFDSELKRWVPTADDSFVHEYETGYLAPDAAPDYQESSRGGRKRKKDRSNDREDGYNGRSKSGKRQATTARQPPQPKQNTAVYVTGLPADATADEVHELFSRKCGVVAEEIDSGRPRIKLYADAATGAFKGDALVVFFKPQSVDMAIMLLDDTDFRFNPDGTSSGRMRVQAADLSYKKTNYDEGGGGGNNSGNNGREAGHNKHRDAAARDGAGNGNGDGARSAGASRRNNEQDKQKIIKRTQKLDAKLADWDDDDGGSHPLAASAGLAEARAPRWDKVVILTHMFTLRELEEDPAALLDIKDDIREECEKLGPVTNVVLFDLEEEGIVSVKFQSAEAADACVGVMHGRSFDGRTVEAYFATGRERFRKSKQKGNEGGEDEDEDDD